MTIDDNFINKRVQLFIHQTKKKLLVRQTRLQNSYLISYLISCLIGLFLKSAEAASGGVLQEKVFLKISQTSQESTCVGVIFYEVAGLQPAGFLKGDSNTSAFL